MPSLGRTLVAVAVTVSLAATFTNAQMHGGVSSSSSSTVTTEVRKSLRVDKKISEPLAIDKGEFGQSEDWLKTLALTVHNTSTKGIVYAEYELVLQGVRSTSGMPMTLPVYYGNYGVARGDMPLSDAKAVKPDMTAKLSVNSKDYKQLLDDLKTVHAKPPVEATLRLRFVCFEDGTAWRDGRNGTIAQLRAA
jgi:hypothetical protein